MLNPCEQIFNPHLTTIEDCVPEDLSSSTWRDTVYEIK